MPTTPFPCEVHSHEIQAEIYRKMSPEEKFQQLIALDQMARTIKAAGLRNLHPEWSENRIQNEVKRIFLYAVD